MKIKAIAKSSFKLDSFFILMLFFFTLFNFDLFGTFLKDTEVLYLLILSSWAIVKSLFFKNPKKKIYGYDILLFLMFGCLLLNFTFITKLSFYTLSFWTTVSHFLALYMFVWFLQEDANKKRINFIIVLICVFSCIQSLISLAQYFKIVKVENPYFSLVGSFSSPNFLALYVSTGLVIISWFFLFKKATSTLLKITVIIASLLISVILLSKSRGTWLSFSTSIFLLFLLSKQGVVFWRQRVKKTKYSLVLLFSISVISLGVLLVFLNIDSVKGRGLILKIALPKLFEKPITGYGIASFPREYNKAKISYFSSSERVWEEVKVANYVTNPFNDYLYIAYELGLVFLVLLLITCIVILAKTRINKASILAITILANIMVWAIFNTAVQTISLVLIGLVAIAILITSNKSTQFIYLGKTMHKFILLCLITFCLFNFYIIQATLSSSHHFEKLTVLTNRTKAQETLLFKYAQRLDDHKLNNFKTGSILYKLGYEKEGIDLMENAFYNTLYPKIGESLFKIYVQNKLYKKAKEIGEINIGLEPYRFEPRINLAILMEETKDFKRALELYQQIEQSPIKIKNKQAVVYKSLSERKIKHLKTLLGN